MKNFLLLRVISFNLLLLTGSFAQDIPETINFQGVLKDASGNIVPDGNYFITFRLYDSDVGGTELWMEAKVVNINSGIMNTQLGSVSPLNSILFVGATFLGITIETGSELTPRTALTSSPYSFMSMDIADSRVVKSLNDLKDHINLVAGSNVTITPSGNDLVISATGGGGGTIGGSGTTNFIPLFTNSTTIGNSIISQNTVGIDINSTASSNINPILNLNRTGSNSATSIRLTNSAGNYFNLGMRTDGKFGVSSLNTNLGLSDIFTINTSSRNVGIGTTSPSYPLHVASNRKYAGLFSTDSLSNDAVALRGVYTGTGNLNAIGVEGQSTPDDGFGIGGQFQGGYVGVVSAAILNTTTRDGIGVYCSAVGGSGTNYGIIANATGGSTNWAGWFNGNVNVSGTLSKGGGCFKIDHPLDPANKYLYHSFVESPDMMNIYNGNIITDGSGYAIVTLPDWFEALNKDFRYQLTVIGDFAQAIIIQEVQNNHFVIKTDEPNIKVSWQVTGIRHDAFAEKNRIPVEVMKKGDEVGKYIYPDAFGLPENMGIDYQKHRLEELKGMR